MKLTQYLLAIVMFGAWTTEACPAKTPRPVSKAAGGAGPVVNAGNRQGSGANGAAETAKAATGGKTEAGNPIEMAIPEPRRAPTNSKPIDWKKIGVVGVPSTSSQIGAVPALSGLSRRQNSAPGTAGVAKNAIAPVSPGSIATGSGATVANRTAIGAAAPNPQPGATGVNMGRQGAVVAPAPRGPVSLPTAVEGSIARNAIGAPAPGNTSAVAARINGPALGRPMAPPVSPAATAMNHAVINGTGMGRPSGTAIIGGATKSVTAVINGTSLRPKHP